MKVLVIAPQPFYTPRGTPFSVYYRTLVMAQLGARIDLLTYGTGHDVDIPGARIRRIPRFRWLEPIPVGPSWTKLFLDILMVIWTVSQLVRQRYDVVHAHEEAVFWCRFLKPIFGFRLIYDMHSSLPQQLMNFEFTKSRFLIRLFGLLEASSLKASNVIVTVCPDLRDQVLAAGVDPERHMMIENSLFDAICVGMPQRQSQEDSAGLATQFGPDHRLICYAGTFESYQGIDLLIEAFAEVIRQVPMARLLLVGGSPQQVRDARQVAISLGVRGKCVVAGSIPKIDASALLCRAEILVSPRLRGTNTPMKIYEQLASGRPLVATRIWSHTQVLDESLCFLVEPTARSLADGLVLALTDPAESASRAQRAKEFYEQKYSRQVYEGKMRQILEKVS